MKNLLFFSTLIIFISGVTCNAYDLTNVSSSAYPRESSDRTRIQFSANSRPVFRVQKDSGVQYSVHFFGVDNQDKRLGMVNLKKGSVISNIGIVRSPNGHTNEIKYVFFMKKPVKPSAYLSGNSLIVDFPDNETGGKSINTVNTQTANKQQTNYDNKTVSSDNVNKADSEKQIQTLTPAEAELAKKKLAEQRLAEKKAAEMEKQRQLQAAKQAEIEKQRQLQAAKQAEIEKQRQLQAAKQTEIEKQRQLQAAKQAEIEKQRQLQAAKQAENKTSEIKAGEVRNLSDEQELEQELYSSINSEGDGKKKTVQNIESRLSAPEPPRPEMQRKKENSICTIVIDPGHGGKDPGATGVNRIYEKNVTLGISKSLFAYINADPMMKGGLTRSSDIFIELGRRSEIARAKKADFLISIHADSAQNSEANGATVLVLNKDRAARENRKVVGSNGSNTSLLSGAGEIIKGHNQDTIFSQTIIDMASDNSRNEGNELAKEILDSLNELTDLHKSTPINRSLAVLKAPDIPSLLIETGYLSNEDESRLLGTGKYQRAVAHAIYKGIRNYIVRNRQILRCGTGADAAVSVVPSSTSVSTSDSVNRKGGNGELTVKGTRKYYVVKKGESLSQISARFGVKLSWLLKHNKTGSNGSVYSGQKILIWDYGDK